MTNRQLTARTVERSFKEVQIYRPNTSTVPWFIPTAIDERPDQPTD